MGKNKPRKPKPVIPVGQPLNWTDADTSRLSQITEEDKAAARAFWRRQAPRAMRRLLDAKAKR